MKDLKPCPFCGEPAEVDRGSYVGVGEVERQIVEISCSNHCCDCPAAELAVDGQSDDEAADLWNTRGGAGTQTVQATNEERRITFTVAGVPEESAVAVAEVLRAVLNGIERYLPEDFSGEIKLSAPDGHSDTCRLKVTAE